jgi:hypothetical protein
VFALQNCGTVVAIWKGNLKTLRFSSKKAEKSTKQNEADTRRIKILMGKILGEIGFLRKRRLKEMKPTCVDCFEFYDILL